MKQGQTYHEIDCDCSLCLTGETRHPDRRIRNDAGELMYVKNREQICQATFKNHCQYPKCDCDRLSRLSRELKEMKSDIMDVLDGPDQECYLNPNLDPIQNNCPYGYVLPDRCRYTAHLGCDCGAYPPLKWDGEKYVSTEESSA